MEARRNVMAMAVTGGPKSLPIATRWANVCENAAAVDRMAMLPHVEVGEISGKEMDDRRRDVVEDRSSLDEDGRLHDVLPPEQKA